MSDKELIQERISELEHNIEIGKQSGKTYKAINRIIEELFTQPIGSQIALVDNPKSENNDALKSFVSIFSKRMLADFPDVDFKVQYPSPGVAVVVRTSETYQEIAKKRLNQWKDKLKEME